MCFALGWSCNAGFYVDLRSRGGYPRPFFQDSTVFQWQNQTLRSDLILVLPIALCLAIGIAIGHPAVGMIAAGGAVNTGFGQKHAIDNSSLLPMIFVTFGTTFSGFLGILLGHENLLLVLASALLAFGYGMLTAWPGGYGWVGQQCVITFLVTSTFPASPSAAFDQSLVLFSGGALQLILSSLVLHLFHDLRTRLFQLTYYLREEEVALRAALAQTAESVRELRFLNSPLPYSIRLAVTIAIATEIYRRLHYPSGYWIPMTALLVLRPTLIDTVSRVLARTLGTMCGAIAASFCLAPHSYNADHIGRFHGSFCVAGLRHSQRELCSVFDGRHGVYRLPSLAE